ncbi:Arginase/deacetylase [Patellaria atrata CBS 101060]|uniref:Arginase/deacetylase n=1 Tax=Patellaria atrata CBS 101060 TaxID=1346257 RepID=A0A9P4S4X2_9PEZI|nr:Arginase/deacetylase [Patellaria atrata CBS 101060]
MSTNTPGLPAPRVPLVSTNQDSTLTANSSKRLSLNTASKTPLPVSPGYRSPSRNPYDRSQASNSPTTSAPPSPLRRSSSSASLNRAPRSPGLLKKASTSSLRGRDMPSTPRAGLARRSSSNLLASPGGPLKSPLATSMEAPPLTAAEVASTYFQKELSIHQDENSTAKTVVILHDACYGHRYSRPKTTKSTLSLIVERPERIHAGVLGIAAAYVRLGEKHAEGHSPPHPSRSPDHQLPFKIIRTSRNVSITSSAVTNVHGTKWMQELKTMCDTAGQKLATTGKELVRTEEPYQQPKEKFHEGDLYLSPESLGAFEGALGGVCDGVDAVFEGSKTPSGPTHAFVCVRPPGHHCSADFPSGFCWINNVHIGIQHAAQAHGLTHAAIIDFDLHHGDGSQEITWDHNAKLGKLPKNTPNSKKASIGYFSLHDINSYPCESGDEEKVQNASLCIENAHGQSIWNVHLQPWKTEDDFWTLYETRYKVLINKARAFLRNNTERLKGLGNHPPGRAAIFLSAGFDASEWESQGMQRHKVFVPTEFYARLTQDVVKMSEEEGLGVDGRIISVLEGGYSDRALMTGVLSHLSGLCDGQTLPSSSSQPDSVDESGLGWEMVQKLTNMKLDDKPKVEIRDRELHYDTNWWEPSSLSTLESLVYPAPLPSATIKSKRTAPTHNYSSPTQASVAKVAEISKIHRSSSGSYRNGSLTPSRAATPPPPDVDWITATYELSKLLIPTDRTTKSCKPEELTATAMKKDRRSSVASVASVSTAAFPPTTTVAQPSGRQLRGRKPKVPYGETVIDDDKDPLKSRGDRRKTMGALPPRVESAPKPTQPRRRLSVASSVSSIGDRTGVLPSGIPISRLNSATSTSASAMQGAVRKPRASSKPPVPVRPSVTARIKSVEQKSSKVKSETKDEDPMDQLSRGLKRITLKVPSKEEHEAKLQKKVDGGMEKNDVDETGKKKPQAPKTASKKGAVGRPPKITTTTSKQRVLPSADSNSFPIPQVPQPAQSQITSPHDALQRVVSPSAPLSPSEELPISQFEAVTELLPQTASPPRPDTPPPPPPAVIPQFIQYDPYPAGSHPIAASMGQHFATPPLQWLPPNTDTAATGTFSPPPATSPETNPLTGTNQRE